MLEIPKEVDIETVMSWKPEDIRTYIEGIQEALQQMRPLVGAVQDWSLGGMTTEQTNVLLEAVRKYRLPEKDRAWEAEREDLRKRYKYQDFYR